MDPEYSNQELQAVIAALRTEVETLQKLSEAETRYKREHKKVLELKRQLQFAESRADRTWEMLVSAGQAQQPIPDDMLDRLIRLCHPDKHSGSEAATVATQWLLSQRKTRYP